MYPKTLHPSWTAASVKNFFIEKAVSRIVNILRIIIVYTFENVVDVILAARHKRKKKNLLTTSTRKLAERNAITKSRFSSNRPKNHCGR